MQKLNVQIIAHDEAYKRFEFTASVEWPGCWIIEGDAKEMQADRMKLVAQVREAFKVSHPGMTPLNYNIHPVMR